MAFASINQASVGGGSSNALSIQSDGIFMPRLSTGQRTALALTTSDAGLTVYDFTLNNLFIWNGTAWESIPGSGDAGANGSVQYNDNGIVSGASNFTYNKATGLVSLASAAITGVSTFAAGTALLPALTTTGDPNTGAYFPAADIFAITTDGVERYRVDSLGNLLVGTTTASAGVVFKVTSATASAKSFEVYSAASALNPAFFVNGNGTVNGVGTGANASPNILTINRDTGTLRSINAAGSINASGADYAEYMTKSDDFVIAKGDVAGIDENGKLTNVFADAVSFVVKSTDPSYVGNDKWGVDLEGAALETARQLVDRIAFAGQVPVNVTGAKAGDYIVPVVNGTGIKGISVSKPTFEQYQLAVGKVITIDTDGRARIIVKVA